MGGFKQRLVALAALPLALAALVSCTLIPSQGLQTSIGQVSSTATKDYAVGASPQLVVNNQVGKVSVQPGDAGKISVKTIKRALSQDALDRIEVTMTQNGDVVQLEYRLPQGMGSITTGEPNVEFVVTAPAATRANLTTETGAIDVSGLTNGLVAKASTGAITTHDVKGLQNLAASTGAITAGGADGTVQATTTTGAVSVDGNLTGENWARATTGAVVVKLPSSANLKVTAKGNSVQNDFGLANQGGQLSGNVGAGTGGSLDASTVTGLVAIQKK
jgi:hypothetical protein